MSLKHQRELPCQVVAVVQAGIEPFSAERAGEVGGVADQESVTIRQAGDDPPVHPERREPADVGRAEFPVEAQALLGLPIASYEPEDCPLCRGGSAAVKPGSRFVRHST